MKRRLSVLVGCLALVGCGATEVRNGARDVGTAARSTPAPSVPVPCRGVTGSAIADDLVRGGQARAFVSVVVKDQPGPLVDNSRHVPIADSTVLAGTLENGGLEVIEESAASIESNVLQPGDYLVLVGETPVKGRYFLSDGLRGSFVLDGANAYERCPNPEDPDDPVVVREGITDVGELTRLFAASFNSSGSG